MWKRLLTAMLLCMTFSGCGSKTIGDDFSKANQKLLQMEKYSCSAKITVYGNKQNSVYKVRQFYMNPDKVRIETIEPQFLNGKVSIFRDGKWFMSHKGINQDFITSRSVEVKDLINVGVITKNLFNPENFKLSYSMLNDKQYIKIAGTIPDGTKYKNSVVLYIDMKEYYPVYMEIYDNKNNKVMEVEYNDFVFNPAIDKSIFDLQ